MRSLLFVLVATAQLACNEAPLIQAPDAAVPCEKPLLISPCVGPQPSGTPGCSSDLQSAQSLGQDVTISPGSYEAGCEVQVNATVLDQGQCTQLGTCDCTQGDGGAFNWVCYASH